MKLLKAKGQTGEATEDDSASNADDQQTLSVRPRDRLLLPQQRDLFAPLVQAMEIGGHVQTTQMPKLWNSFM